MAELNEQLYYPKPTNFTPVYGTAGFRADASLLDSTALSCGWIMAIRALHVGKACGIMVTASHNPDNDNGFKLVDYTGELIDDEWADNVTRLAQIENESDLINEVNNVYSVKYPPHATQKKAKVIIGRDTRESSERLARICKLSVESFSRHFYIDVVDVGLVTTPELQFHVANTNSPHPVTDYVHNLKMSFYGLVKDEKRVKTHLFVDCANGVGAAKLRLIQGDLRGLGLHIHLFNTGKGRLNHLCGADYVEKEQKFPINMEDICEYERCCSIDGDADRIVYFTKRNGRFILINGDKIAILFASFIDKLFGNVQDVPKIGLVQTAYANGASTKYMKDKFNNVDVVCTPTGVKNLHHAANEFDIGVYFEANGHGTALISPDIQERLACPRSKNKLMSMRKLLSQVTGDALGDMLMVEAILHQTDCDFINIESSFINWTLMYDDLPCKQVKVRKDRNLFETTDAERRCVKPEGLQSRIDEICSRYDLARCFIRPSGTEDCVRVYVEAQRKMDVDLIADEVLEVLDSY